MTAPTIAWGTVQRGTSVTGASFAVDGVAIPTGNVGDLLVAIQGQDATPVLTAAGWTKVVEQSNTAKLFVRLRLATGSDTWTNGVTSANDYAILFGRVPRAEHGVVNVSQIAVGAANSTTTTADPPSVTGNQGTRDYLSIACANIDTSASGNTISAYPSGYTGVMTQAADQTVPNAVTASTSSVVLAVATKALTAAASENPGTFTNTSRPWCAATILIPPANAIKFVKVHADTGGGSGGAANTTTDVVTASFSPVAIGNFLVVIAQGVLGAGPASLDLSIASTLSVGTWVEDTATFPIGIAGYNQTASVFIAPITGTGAGTITVSRTAGSGDWEMEVSVVEYAGLDTADAVIQTAQAHGDTTSQAATLGSALTTGSAVIAAFFGAQVPTNPTGYGQLGAATLTGTDTGVTTANLWPQSTTVTFTGLTAASGYDDGVFLVELRPLVAVTTLPPHGLQINRAVARAAYQ